MDLGMSSTNSLLADIHGIDITSLPDNPDMKTALDLVLKALSTDGGACDSTNNNSFTNSIA